MRDDAVLRRALPLGRGLGRLCVAEYRKQEDEILKKNNNNNNNNNNKRKIQVKRNTNDHT